ncbi:PVC-type heme-binding CxxCH protein [Horticoccus sp. 23ND18S-11]|uniref:PVC-type heme-binding CxxCH protein n=1 Tax=Horticoccus sp. 23ND18S-11 TaxID=3391832 RepID=UPI0039C9EAD3
MKRFLVFALLLISWVSAADAPLRVFIRSGPKSHGPGAHDYPRFLAEWVPLLNARGAKATGANQFPTAQQLAETDVLILHAQEAGNIPDATDRKNLNAFLARGGGLVVLHAGAVSRDPDWFKTIVGGSWRNGTTKWLEAPMHLYFVDRQHAITRDVSNWGMNDEIYYDMEMLPEAHVLATAYTPKSQDTGGRGNREAQARAAEAVATRKAVNIYDIQPQMWTYERTADGGSKPYRAFVSIPGHLYENFNRPNYRSIILRGIAWAGQRKNTDELCIAAELGDALRYPEGGPTHPLQAAAKIEVHPEFKLSLVASEPLVNKVMNIDWDERGRLWVCETPEYPNGRRVPNTAPWKDSGSLRGAKVQRDPEDSISVLTDTNGDGIMDKKQVFADKLELVTSFVLHKNGVIAACSPDIWFLEDTNNDGVADKRTKLYTGLGINDTHAVINNLRWGLDGWIYATHGYSRGDVTSGDGKTKFGPDGSGVVRFKPDGTAFEQYSSRGGNTWGLQVTWDGQVFWTQPTSGTVFFHTVLPERVLEKGKLPGVTSWKGMITNAPTFPLMTWPEQAYVQIDQVGRFTAAAGCAIYEGGAWPDKWNYSYFTGEPTLNIVHHQFVRPDGVSYSVEKEKGREETEFMRSRDLWFRPIETRIGPDGALYVVDFYNQAVIHNDTRGPLHSPSNAAVRPDRDHYFSRIWRVQHKDAKTLAVPALDRRNLAALIKTIETSPNAHVKQNAWRLVQENHGAAGAKALVDLKRPMGSKVQQRYEAARAANTPASRQAILADFVAATDDWTKSALIAAAADQPAEFIVAALQNASSSALTSFVAALVPRLTPAGASTVVQAAGTAGPAAKAATIAVLRALAQWEGTAPAVDATLTAQLQRLIENPDTAAGALPLVAKWDTTGQLSAATGNVTRQLAQDLDRAQTPDARRADIVAALLALPQSRASALAKAGALLVDPATSPALTNGLLAALGDVSGANVDATLLTAFAKTKSSAIFEQLLKRPDSSMALLNAIKDGRIRAADVGPGNLARLRTHPIRRVATEAGRVLDTLSPETKAKDDLIAKLLPEVTKPGNVANGRMLFTGACSICHKFGDIGLRDVGPPLAGIGAKGAAELLVHIVDPNRQVEPNYWQWNVTTKKGETFVGVIANENATSLTLRNQGGDSEVKKDDIATRDNTRRSLMPEGLEGLGAESLRDLIAFMVSASTPATPASGNAPARTTATPAAGLAAAAGVMAAVEGPKEGGRGDFPLPPVTPVQWEAGKKRVLIIGGGSSHKFAEFFGVSDSATLRAAGYSVNYTEDRDQAAAELGGADVAVISVNRKFFDTPAYRKALFDFAAAGKGIVMLHPGTWYGFAAWPELNAKIVGGGARGHDKLGKYSVNAVKPGHPIMKGVPATFDVEDELYYINAEPDKIPAGTSPIEVLAETSPSIKYKAPHPVIWTTKHERARIVGFTLGHDQRVHDHPAYKTMLVNAVTWASVKN